MVVVALLVELTDGGAAVDGAVAGTDGAVGVCCC